MSLSEYFENSQGTGILATADADGKVDAAVYGRPHVIDENTVAFIMSQRLSYSNVQSNGQAAYLFMEKGPGYKGKRLYLTKTKETDDPELIDSIRRSSRTHKPEDTTKKFLVYFRVDKTRELIGD